MLTFEPPTNRLDIYLAIDVSMSMGVPDRHGDTPLHEVMAMLTAAIEALESLRSESSAPLLALGAIEFASTARTILPLAANHDPSELPELRPQRGRTSYAAAFRHLTSELTAARRTSLHEVSVHSVVFLISDGEPTDSTEHWQAALDDLVKSAPRPQLYPCMLTHEATAAVGELRRNNSNWWFVPPPGTPAKAAALAATMALVAELRVHARALARR